MKASKDPKYLTLARRFARQIRSGQLQPGDRLPSFTQMRAEFGATPATVERLYAQLERDDLIERRHRSGVFVNSTQDRNTLQGTIGFVSLSLNRPHLHPYGHHLLQGIHQEAGAAGIQVLLLDHGSIAASRKKIDGLLIYEHELAKYFPYQDEGIPCVSLIKHTDEIASVVADDFAGGYLAAKHLLDLGHRRITCLMGTAADDIHDALGAQRLAGYRAALQEAGITPDPAWVRPVLYNPLENYAERGRTLMRQWLDEGWSQLDCTAILAQNDDVAIGIIKELQEEEYQVPRDISVVGFDGSGVDAHFSPRLTTIEVPLGAIGRIGTQMLLQQITEKRRKEHVVLPTSLQQGKSTAAPKVLLASSDQT
jgi:DNA-binding LacI/PurR family transcriptional regulator